MKWGEVHCNEKKAFGVPNAPARGEAGIIDVFNEGGGGESLIGGRVPVAT